ELAGGRHAVEDGHVEIQHDHVNLSGWVIEEPEELGAVPGGSHDLDVPAALQEQLEPLPEDRAVVSERDADHRSAPGRATRTAVPPPAPSPPVSLPPSCAIRAAIPERPTPAAASPSPRPSSRTSARSRSPVIRRVTVAPLPPECRAALRTASLMTRY